MGLGHTKKPMSQAMAATSAPHSEATWGPVPYGFTWTPRRRNRNWVQWAALNFYLEMPHISKQESKKCIEVCLWWLWWYIYIYICDITVYDYDWLWWLWMIMVYDDKWWYSLLFDGQICMGNSTKSVRMAAVWDVPFKAFNATFPSIFFVASTLVLGKYLLPCEIFVIGC